MATIEVGLFKVDLEKLSDEEADVLLQYDVDKVMTDDVIAALCSYTTSLGSGRSTEGEESKASKMRRMAAAGMTTGDIAKLLGVRFQFVYNVLQRASQKAS